MMIRASRVAVVAGVAVVCAGFSAWASESSLAQVTAVITTQSANGITAADLDQNVLKNFEQWTVQTLLSKGRASYAEGGRDPKYFNPRVESSAVYVSAGVQKLAIVRVRMDPELRMVTVLGIVGTELRRVGCIRGSDHDIPIWSGSCGAKVKEAFGVDLLPR